MADRTATTEQGPGKSQDTAPGVGTAAARPSELGTQMRDRAQELGEQVQELAQEIGTQVRDWAQGVGGQLKEGAQEAIRQVETSTSQLSAQGHEAVGQLEKTLEDDIRAKPFQSLLIAAGVGMVLGALRRK